MGVEKGANISIFILCMKALLGIPKLMLGFSSNVWSENENCRASVMCNSSTTYDCILCENIREFFVFLLINKNSFIHFGYNLIATYTCND